MSIPGWDRQTIPPKPHGWIHWIQWKGTEVCMDIYCVCGNMSHIDADFAYNVMCPYCKRIFMINGHVELVELTEDEKTSPVSCLVKAEK